jgi:hypothetical protein
VQAIPRYEMFLEPTLIEKEVVVSHCNVCEGEIYKGEEILSVEDEYVHDECFYEYAKNVLDAYYDYAE